MTTCADGLPQLWDLAPGGTAVESSTLAPVWLPEVIEACAFRSLDEFGSLQVGTTAQMIQLKKERLASTSNEPWEVFGRWLFTSPEKRSPTPWGNESLQP